SSRSEAGFSQPTFHNARSANGGEVSNEEAGVHRAFVLGLIGSVLGLARPEGQWLCRRGDLGSQRGEEPNSEIKADSERFRSLKDLRALPEHPKPAVSWHSGFRGGAHVRPKTTPVHHA